LRGKKVKIRGDVQEKNYSAINRSASLKAIIFWLFLETAVLLMTFTTLIIAAQNKLQENGNNFSPWNGKQVRQEV